MTKEESTVKSDGKMDKERHGRQRGQKKEKPKLPSKIIIRHLPPTMTEEEFLKQIDPMPAHDFYYFVPADWSLGYDATCRAYITLKNYEEVFLFRDRFDGYVFVDSKGAEYPAIVEFAPFQGLAKNKSRRTDNKVNTIDLEPHYQQFLTKLEEDREAASKGNECKLEVMLDRKKEEKITSTPLLQYLALKKEKRREEAKKRMEEKRRQRDEEKDKRRQSQHQVTKIMTGRDLDKKDSKSTISSKDSISGKNESAQEEPKNSRTKRRAARDQRRREEHEQRKKEKERLEREQKEKGHTGQSEKPSVKAEVATGDTRSQENQHKSEDAKQRRSEKRYSERRERDRNRKRKEKDSEKGADATLAEGDKMNAEAVKTPAKESEVNDVVKNFILSVANAKEFVPRHKQQEQEKEDRKQDESASSVNEADLKDSLENPEREQRKPDMEKKVQVEKKVNVEKKDEAENAAEVEKNADVEKKVDTEKNVEVEKKMDVEKTSELEKKFDDEQKQQESTNTALDENQLQKQRSTEERRIRNKDRPSIAIYQPKARLRQSEETEPTIAGRDVRRNSTSDCELGKKDDERTKKVSRYSERRAERRASKQKTNPADVSESENADHTHYELRKSKSCEDDDVGETREATPKAGSSEN